MGMTINTPPAINNIHLAICIKSPERRALFED
jgi:hypothetical protein